MPERWSPLYPIESGRGGLDPEEEESRTLGPIYRRLRMAGRTRFTFFSRLDPASKRVILRGMKSFSQESSAAKEVWFNHVLDELTPAQQRQLDRMRVTREELVQRLANARHGDLEKILTHDKVVAGFKKAGDRFGQKNFGRIWMGVVKGRVGFTNLAFRGSAKDDFTTGLLAAIEHHGIPEAREVRRPEPGVREPPEPRPEPGPREPPAPEEVEEEEERGEREPKPPEEPKPGEPGRVDMSAMHLYSVLGQALGRQPIRLAQLVHRGIKHHEPSKSFHSTANETETRRAVSSLLTHASLFSQHVMTLGLKPSDADTLVEHTMDSDTHGDFQDELHKLLQARNPKARLGRVLKGFAIPTGHKLFDESGRIVRGASIDNFDRLRVGATKGTAKELTPEQKQLLAFHLSAKLAKLGSPVTTEAAGEHLKRFLHATHQSATAAALDWYNLRHQPTIHTLSSEQVRRLMALVAMHTVAHR